MCKVNNTLDRDKRMGCGIEKVKFEWKSELSEGAKKHNYRWRKNISGRSRK